MNWDIDGSLQERRKSSALAMESHLSFTKPSIWFPTWYSDRLVRYVWWMIKLKWHSSRYINNLQYVWLNVENSTSLYLVLSCHWLSHDVTFPAIWHKEPIKVCPICLEYLHQSCKSPLVQSISQLIFFHKMWLEIHSVPVIYCMNFNKHLFSEIVIHTQNVCKISVWDWFLVHCVYFYGCHARNKHTEQEISTYIRVSYMFMNGLHSPVHWA